MQWRTQTLWDLRPGWELQPESELAPVLAPVLAPAPAPDLQLVLLSMQERLMFRSSRTTPKLWTTVLKQQVWMPDSATEWRQASMRALTRESMRESMQASMLGSMQESPWGSTRE